MPVMRSWKVQARTVQAAVLRAPFLGEPERGHSRDPHLHLVPQGAVSHWDSFVLLESEVLDLLGWDPEERRSCLLLSRSCLLSDHPSAQAKVTCKHARRRHCSTTKKERACFPLPVTSGRSTLGVVCVLLLFCWRTVQVLVSFSSLCLVGASVASCPTSSH